MRIFEIVKENVNLREAAELYGIDVNRYGKALCPFHNDRHPRRSSTRNGRSLALTGRS